jgi:hypothetical protein
LLKLERNQKEKRHLLGVFIGRRKKIMKIILVLHVGETMKIE